MSLEVVVGPMFSGKSSYAVSYTRRQRAIGKSVLVIKPDIDNRYGIEEYLMTHDNDRVQCKMWKVREPLCKMTDLNYDCYVVEEAQFFEHLQHFCYELVMKRHKNVLVVGLDGCAQQKKFGEILDVIPMASSVKKLTALCSVCKDGTPAPYTKKYIGDWGGEQVDVGGLEKYAAVCLKHL